LECNGELLTWKDSSMKSLLMPAKFYQHYNLLNKLLQADLKYLKMPHLSQIP
jgi:hypothetical protein